MSIGNEVEKDLKAVLLVGGLGTRLRSVLPSAPKPLASVGGRTFLELLVLQLRNHGIRQLVMCTGYLGAQIEDEFGDGKRFDVSIAYSREQQPLGTAGALRLASALLRDSREFVVMNGDSFLEVNFMELVQCHRKHKGIATLAVRRVEDAARYGTVEVGPDGRVARFVEKTGRESAGLVNGGVYIFNAEILDFVHPGVSSLEREVFPRVLHLGLYASEQHGLFIDIGTPEDYARAQMLQQTLTAKATIIN